jgi:hypothetical protein
MKFSNSLDGKRGHEVYVELALAIDAAIRKQRALDGLSITPKVHNVDDHGLKLFENMPGYLFYCIEEFVEQNHQIGHKEEERVWQIRKAGKRGKSKAEQKWVSMNSKVQMRNRGVKRLNTRGPYMTAKLYKFQK